MIVKLRMRWNAVRLREIRNGKRIFVGNRLENRK
jgi:hypothetical protein